MSCEASSSSSTSCSSVSKKARAPLSEAPREADVERAVAIDLTVRDERRRPAGALVDVDRVVGVARRQLSRPCRRRPASRRRRHPGESPGRAVSAHALAPGDPPRHPLGALIEVGLIVGVGGHELLDADEEDPRAVVGGTRKDAGKSPLPLISPSETSVVVPPAALIEVEGRVGVVRGQALERREDHPRAVLRGALEEGVEGAVAVDRVEIQVVWPPERS